MISDGDRIYTVRKKQGTYRIAPGAQSKIVSKLTASDQSNIRTAAKNFTEKLSDELEST